MSQRRQSAAEARAEVEARRAANRDAREAALAAHFPGELPGRAIVWANWAATAVFSVIAVAAAIAPETLIGPAVAVSLGLFAIGSAVFLLALWFAAIRSREALMGMGGLFLLLDAAPRAAKWHLLGATTVQTVVSVATAAVRPFTPMAFGVLVPMVGIACTGLWSVRHGWFPPRSE